MNNKYELRQKVFYKEELWTINGINVDCNKFTFTLVKEDIASLVFKYAVKEEEIQPYIEEDTQEDETQDENWKTPFPPLSGKMQLPVGLDYEKEYNLLLEEHEQTKELLEIAKVALKLTTELISTND